MPSKIFFTSSYMINTTFLPENRFVGSAELLNSFATALNLEPDRNGFISILVKKKKLYNIKQKDKNPL